LHSAAELRATSGFLWKWRCRAKASQPHQYWFIDGRMMDFAFDGVRWWSILILAGYSRTILAGALAPSEAS
jgi:hypothetical protein